MILDDTLNLAEQANQHLLHHHLHLSLPPLHLKHQVLPSFKRQLFVF